MNRASMCDFLFQRHERDPFLKRLVNRDETCILYQNVETWFKNNRLLRSLDFTRRRFFIHLMRLKNKIFFIFKVKLSILKNIVITLIKWRHYSRKTAKIGEPIRPSRQCKIAYYINYKRKVVTIWYHIFCIILYSDFALSDLFLSLKNSFHDKRFQSVNKKNASQVYFANKPQKKEIMRLPKKGRRR